MLTLLSIRRPEDKAQVLEKFDPNTMTWLVSDLRTKFEIQKFVLKKQSYFEDLSVYRASELWRLLLKKTQPDLKWVSKDMIGAFVREWVESKEDLKVGQGADRVVGDFLDLFISVFSHREGPRLLQEWWKQHLPSYQRWGGWTELAYEIHQELQKKQWTSPAWASALLQNETDFEKFWNRPLIIDLGCQLKRTEVELIHKISRHCDVTVLTPDPEWLVDFRYLMQGYEDLRPHGQVQSISSQGQKTSKPRSKKYSGILGEVKGAVAQVRAWLDQGVSPQSIALLMPDVEAYWPILHPILKEEGIPVQKDMAVRLQTFPVILSWLAEMRIRSNKVSFADLEQSQFQNEEQVLPYDQFFSLFSLLLDPEDLKRDPTIWKAYSESASRKEVWSRDQFVGWSLKSWKKWEQTEGLEVILREILSQAGPEENLKLGSWIYLVEQVVSKKETKYERGRSIGIQVDSLASGDSLSVTRRVFLGSSEEQLKTRNNRWLDSGEVQSIAAQTGFFLEHPEVSCEEFDLRWLLENATEETVLSYPATGFGGEAEAPHPIWISFLSDGHPSVEVAQDVRWDQKQHLINNESVQLKEEKISLQTVPALSPSTIEKYQKCPFIFAAEKYFRLADLPQVDLDLDDREKGTLNHALLEKITEEPLRFDWSEAEVQAILNDLRVSLKLRIFEETTWKAICHQKQKMVRKFLAVEKERRSQFPQIRIAAREQGFEVKLSLDEFAVGSDVLFRGKIDRIDVDQENRVMIYDYKTSAGSWRHSGSWIESNHLQLGMYSLIIEKGMIPQFSESEVVSALYYSLKEMTADKGFKVESSRGELFLPDKKKNWISEENKEQLLQQFADLIKEILQKMKNGEIQPAPLDVKQCFSCEWSDLCRAPHLR